MATKRPESGHSLWEEHILPVLGHGNEKHNSGPMAGKPHKIGRNRFIRS